MRVLHELKFGFKEDGNFVVEKIKLKRWEQISWQLDGGCRINFSIDVANGADADFFSEFDGDRGSPQVPTGCRFLWFR
jgi:hypothetical protein